MIRDWICFSGEVACNCVPNLTIDQSDFQKLRTSLNKVGKTGLLTQVLLKWVCTIFVCYYYYNDYVYLKEYLAFIAQKHLPYLR